MPIRIIIASVVIVALALAAVLFHQNTRGLTPVAAYEPSTAPVQHVAAATSSAPATPASKLPVQEENILTNGTLDLADDTGNAPRGWSSNANGDLDASFTYPADGAHGRGAEVRVTRYVAGDAKWYFQHVPVSAHVIYRYEDSYRSSAPTNVTAEFVMGDGSRQYGWLAQAPAASTWRRMEADVTVPPGAVSMTVYQALVGAGDLTIDDVSLSALPADPFPEAMISFTFDDGLQGVFEHARSILNEYHVPSTQYIITQAAGASYMTWDAIARFGTDGAEIGGHTRTHPDLTKLSAADAREEIRGSFEDLRAHGFSPQTFAYPYGAYNATTERLVKDVGYRGARGSFFGLNTPHTDPFGLRDIHVESGTKLEDIERWIDQAAADRRWLILEFHDESSQASEYAITPETLRAIVGYAQKAGITPVTVAEGIGYLR